MDFGELLQHSLLHGFVWSGPDYFALVRSCHRIAPQLHCAPGEGDSIFVTLLTGNMAACLRHNRGISGYLTFARIAKGRTTFKTYPYAKVERHGISRNTSSANP